MDSLVQEMSPKLSAHRDSILLNKDLFHRVKSVYEKRKSLSLNPEQTRLIEETHKYFVRAGVQLDENSMERLTEINQKLSSLSVQFDQNLLKETNEGFILVIDDKDQLHGLPKDVVDQASALAESENHSGKWLFKPTRASMYPFLTYSTERDLREELYNSYIKRGDNNNERDNKNIAIEI
jgi:peptidyl-dipeptidase Dcp